MKTHQKYLLLAVALSAFIIFNSCEKDTTDDCINGICPCEDTIYYTHEVWVDTFIMLDAEYIFPPELVVDTFRTVHIDTFRYGNFRSIYAFADFKHLLNEEDSISFVYRGGIRGVYAFKPPIVAGSWGCDPQNSVFIAKDTVFHYLEHTIPYAILEIFEGSDSFIDTVFYPIEFSRYDSKYLESHLINISVEFANNGFATDTKKFEEYLKGYYNIANTGYYFTDVFPPMETGWDNQDFSFILFKND